MHSEAMIQNIAMSVAVVRASVIMREVVMFTESLMPHIIRPPKVWTKKMMPASRDYLTLIRNI